MFVVKSDATRDLLIQLFINSSELLNHQPAVIIRHAKNSAGFKDTLHLLDGEIRSHLSVESLLSLIRPEEKKLLQDFEVRGDCQALTLLHGSLRKGLEIRKEHKLILMNGSLSSRDKKINLTDLSCEIFSDGSGIKLSNARFVSANIGAPRNSKAC